MAPQGQQQGRAAWAVMHMGWSSNDDMFLS